MSLKAPVPRPHRPQTSENGISRHGTQTPAPRCQDQVRTSSADKKAGGCKAVWAVFPYTQAPQNPASTCEPEVKESEVFSQHTLP